MDVRINREIRDYSEKPALGLTLQKAFFSGLAAASCGAYFVLLGELPFQITFKGKNMREYAKLYQDSNKMTITGNVEISTKINNVWGEDFPTNLQLLERAPA